MRAWFLLRLLLLLLSPRDQDFSTSFSISFCLSSVFRSGFRILRFILASYVMAICRLKFSNLAFLFSCNRGAWFLRSTPFLWQFPGDLVQIRVHPSYLACCTRFFSSVSPLVKFRVSLPASLLGSF
jgi:hypothetical protein